MIKPLKGGGGYKPLNETNFSYDSLKIDQDLMDKKKVNKNDLFSSLLVNPQNT